jgi:hypothetical protein
MVHWHLMAGEGQRAYGGEAARRRNPLAPLRASALHADESTWVLHRLDRFSPLTVTLPRSSLVVLNE